MLDAYILLSGGVWPPKMQVRILWGAYDRKGCVYSTSKITATGYDVVLGTGSKKENGETRPYQYGNHKKLNLKEGAVWRGLTIENNRKDNNLHIKEL